MLIPRHTLSELDQALRAASGGMRIVSVEVDLDPLDLVRAGSEAFGWASFFGSPEGKSVGGLGTATTFAVGGPTRFEAIDSGIKDLPVGVNLFMGFGFDEDGPSGLDWESFPSAVAVLPEVSVVRVGGRSSLTVAVRPGSDGRLLVGFLSALRAPGIVVEEHEVDHKVESRPMPDDWRDLVAEAVASIGAGFFEKVVLARTVLVHTPYPLRSFDLVSQLRARYPGCRIFGWQ